VQQISQATESIGRQTAQTARAMEEQSRASRDLVTATQDVARQMALITTANREQSTAMESVLKDMMELRRGADGTARMGREVATLGTQLSDRARTAMQPTT
jgi:methyl-accepting chemotaxis protein